MLTYPEMMVSTRSARPLVHFITNYVTVNDVANACICCGGAPVMTDEFEDVGDMVPAASAVVLNIGTLNKRTISSMFKAGEVANENGIPVVLDPVGAGATPLRTDTALGILDRIRVDVIKGNAGEISALAGMGGEVRGVDSGECEDTVAACKALAGRYKTLVAASGAVDYVSDGRKTVALKDGDALLECVSGTGCMLSGVIGSYVGACTPSLESVVAGISAFNIPAVRAGRKASGPGMFKVALFDEIHRMEATEMTPALEVLDV